MSASDWNLRNRSAEIDLLRRTLVRALEGHGQLVVISGEAGIGKSALATAFAAEAEEHGVAVVRGRAWEFAEAPPYFPLWSCLRSIGVEPKASANDAETFRLWELVLESLAREARAAPVFWSIDDIHAADRLTLELLAFLAQPLRALRSVVLVTSREHDSRLDHHATQRLIRMRRDGLDLRLLPLDSAGVRSVAEERVGRTLSPTMAAKLVTLTGGNPLFVVECASALRASGGSESGLASLPATVRQVVSDRLSLLPEATRQALTSGAIVGREFSAALVASMNNRLPARVIDALLPALRAGFLTEAKPGHFVFSHVIVRDAVDESMSAEQRILLHARAESALSRYGEAPEILLERVRHALLALERDEETRARTLALANRAALMLEAQGAFDRAHAIYERVDEARQAGHFAPASTDEALHVASVAAAAGHNAEAVRICDELIARARSTGDVGLLARAALLFGAELRPGTVDKKLVGLLEESLAAPTNGDSALRCRVLARLAGALQPAANARPIDMARAAISQARAIGDDVLLADVLFVAGSALVDVAPIEERVALARELLELARRMGDRPKEMRAHARLAIDAAELGDFAEFDNHVDRLLELANDLAHPRHRWRALLFASMRALSRGDFEESQRVVVEVEQLADSIDDPSLPLTLFAHAYARARLQQRDEEMRRMLPEISSKLPGGPLTRVIGALLRASLSTWLEDRAATANELPTIERHAAFVESDPTFRAVFAESVALAGSDEQRRRVRAALLPVESHEAVGGHVSMSYDGPVRRVLGLLDASLGDLESAERRLRESLATAEMRGHRGWVARIRYDLAQLIAQRGGDAIPMFRGAAALAEELGMPGLRERSMRALDARTGELGRVARAESLGADAPFVVASEGDTWRIEYAGRVVRVRTNRGMLLLARLVAQPGEEIHVLVLASDEGEALAETHAGEQLDARAIREYRSRLAALGDDIAGAESHADLGRIERARAEREHLVRELSRALGTGGARRAGSVTERARVNVQRRLKDAVARIGEVDAEIGRYLSKAVRTGTYCSFRP